MGRPLPKGHVALIWNQPEEAISEELLLALRDAVEEALDLHEAVGELVVVELTTGERQRIQDELDLLNRHLRTIH